MLQLAERDKEIKLGGLPNPMSADARGLMRMLLEHLVFGVLAIVYRPFVF
jgi:hypothetical protein